MLSKEKNEVLTRVGPGTKMGELLRRYWLPALLADELAGPDCAPIRLRLLCEDLVAFRDTEGRIGILDAYCPHRLAQLFFGRNEECGIRCAYHGWKFDVEGNCVDMPSAPPDGDFSDKVKTKAYPTVERGGVIWVYMGPKDKRPELPEFEWTLLPERQRTATKRLQQSNWAQAVEGGIDSSHISFVHRNLEDFDPNKKQPIHTQYARKGNPVFHIQDTGYGLQIGAERVGDTGRTYWRITQYLTPFYSMIPPPLHDVEDSSQLNYFSHAWVPIDDENTWTWSFGASPKRALTDEELERYGGKNGMWGPVDDEYRPLRNKDNDYMIDREIQRTKNFTGILGIPNQDAAVQESAGAITDRSREKLGKSDRAIVAFRKHVLDLAEALVNGIEPETAAHGDWYRVRSASIVLDSDADFQSGASHILHCD